MVCVCRCVCVRAYGAHSFRSTTNKNKFIYFSIQDFSSIPEKQRFLMMFVSTDNTTHNTNTYRYIRLYGANYNLFRLVLYNRLWTLQRQHRRWQRQTCFYVRAFTVEISSAECFRLPFLTCNKCVYVLWHVFLCMYGTQSCAFHLHFISIKKRFSSLIWY